MSFLKIVHVSNTHLTVYSKEGTSVVFQNVCNCFSPINILYNQTIRDDNSPKLIESTRITVCNTLFKSKNVRKLFKCKKTISSLSTYHTDSSQSGVLPNT